MGHVDVPPGIAVDKLMMFGRMCHESGPKGGENNLEIPYNRKVSKDLGGF